MIGFVIGGIAAWGIYRAVRYRRHRRHFAGGYGFESGRGQCGSVGGWGHSHRRWGRGRWGAAYGLFRWLDTTPGQEKALRDTAEKLIDEAKRWRQSMTGSFPELARVLRDESFDEEQVARVMKEQQATVDQIKSSVQDTLREMHAVLDQSQRGRLADWIERRFGQATRDAGPYRTASI